MSSQERFAQVQANRALRAYLHRARKNRAGEAFRKAIAGKTRAYAKALQAEALALCGHPHYALSYRRWCAEALAFLRCFSDARPWEGAPWPQAHFAFSQVEKANCHYHQHYNNARFVGATYHRTTEYANALIDEALAICGHPHHRLSRRRWSAEAVAFLAAFADG